MVACRGSLGSLVPRVSFRGSCNTFFNPLCGIGPRRAARVRPRLRLLTWQPEEARPEPPRVDFSARPCPTLVGHACPAPSVRVCHPWGPRDLAFLEDVSGAQPVSLFGCCCCWRTVVAEASCHPRRPDVIQSVRTRWYDDLSEGRVVRHVPAVPWRRLSATCRNAVQGIRRVAARAGEALGSGSD
jgi:hypothetical protein